MKDGGWEPVWNEFTMKTNCWLFLAAIVALPAFLGCAGPSANAIPGDAKPPPLLLVASAEQGISDEEAALLDPDYFEDEELEEEPLMVADPLEGFNRAMFCVHDKLYFWLFKPVALGYRTVMPQPARSGVKNFFYNLAAPVRIINNILQGKGQAAEAEVARFFYNTTVGVLGFGNPAKKYPGLNPPDEDLGQTLGRYGIGDGFYLVIPGIGPTTLRDGLGLIGDFFLSPVDQYVEPVEALLALKGVTVVNELSFRIGDYETIKKVSLDPYQAIRTGYIQLRQARIKE